MLSADYRSHDINQRQIKQKRGRQDCQAIVRVIAPKSVDEANSRKQDPKRNDDKLSHKATHRATKLTNSLASRPDLEIRYASTQC